MDGENIVIRQTGGVSDMTQVTALNATALELYNHFRDTDFTAQDVSDYLLEQFDVTPETAHRDAEEWVAQMRDTGLATD